MTETGLSIGIDASNIRAGGGLTHLGRLLDAAQPRAAGIDRVVVWSGGHTRSRLPDRPWLDRIHIPALDRALPWRAGWQQAVLPRAVGAQGCDLLFSPGGTLPRRAGVRTVTMSQNMLPFEPEEAARFGRGSTMWWKMRLLRRAQARSFRTADGVIFLTDYARNRVTTAIGRPPSRTAIVPHGLEPRFFLAPRRAVGRDELTPERPFRLVYVSQVDVYKHQWNVVSAVGQLRAEGLPVTLDLVGAAYPPALARLRERIEEVDRAGIFVRYRGLVPFDELHRCYGEADGFVFASTCENMPNILLEAMASGLPVASSSYGPMPEVLGQDAVYFDPVRADSVARALRTMIADAALRDRLAAVSFDRAQAFSWTRCAQDTFRFLGEVARGDQ
ncbi:MAG TPA: glycosyltransferase family 1 protein [Sphingomonas sp.]|jgi:glycosyltransferase involved in cell wall biosynthesis|uniref:glycosyltransferase family 4 protein n=1 Tax=Sphingomonas sp. TaxID=28214 RepID=UPI002EDA857A